MNKFITFIKNAYHIVLGVIKGKQVNKIRSFTRHRLIGFNFTDGIIFKMCVYVILISISYVYIYPLARMVSYTFMSLGDLLDPTIIWISKHPTFDNIKVASMVLKIPSFSISNFTSFEAIGKWFMSWGKSAIWNSTWFSLLLATCQTIVSALAGYAFARYEFAGKKFWMTMLLLSFVIPIPLVMIPRTMMFVRIQDLTPFKMIGTIRPQVILSILGQGIYSTVLILIFNNFFKMIPTVLDEAARIDGASTLQVFYHIIIKMSMSTIVVVMLFSFVWNWNETYISNILLGSGMQLLPLQLGAFEALFSKMQSGAVGIDGEPIKISESYQMAATFITIVPLLIVYAFAQKRFIQGIEQTGITGE
jgi:multiple sugar transport system permease protein